MKTTFRTIFSAAFFCILAIAAMAQTSEKPAQRVIEVTGSAETLVTPNEFTFKITLVERFEKKEKITIEMQEKQLKEALAKAGIDVQKDLTIFDLTSNYISRKKRPDVLSMKDYRLKLAEMTKVEQLQEIADDLNIARLDLIESTHSELTRLRKETKMEAVKAAKAKAEYMLGAIGERVGKPVFLQEVSEEAGLSNFVTVNGQRASTSNITVNSANDPVDTSLTFTKIRLRYAVVAKFEIQ